MYSPKLDLLHESYVDILSTLEEYGLSSGIVFFTMSFPIRLLVQEIFEP